MQAFHSAEAPAAIGPYSQAIAAGGFLFCSGQTGINPSTRQLAGPDVSTQARQVFANIRAVLASAGLTLEDVVKTTVFLKDFNDFKTMNQLYSEAFGDHKPARSTVEVARLPLDCLIEIECIAVQKG